MTYVVITFVVLLVLNVYCSVASQNLFYESKKTSMIEKCLLACDEISSLEVLNASTVSTVIGQIESLKANRLLVTDQTGCTLYDSGSATVGSYALFPEILTALDGNDVCVPGATRTALLIPGPPRRYITTVPSSAVCT